MQRRQLFRNLAQAAALATLTGGLGAAERMNTNDSDLPAVNRLTQGQLILFDGDSMTNRRTENRPDTWPYLRLMNWDRVWPEVMAELLFCWRPELNLSFFNAAAGGSTCRGLMNRLERNILIRQPGWVIVSVAGNDARVGVPHEEYRQTMSTYAQRITVETGAQILFLGVSQHGPDYPKADTMEARRAYYAILADIAKATAGVYYHDLGPALANQATILRQQSATHTIYGDTGHFNAVGHTMVAGQVLRYFGVVN